MEFNYSNFRPYGLAAAALWFAGVIGPDLLNASETVANLIFFAGFIVFGVGFIRQQRSS
jgi:hypothetical protein